MFTYIVSAAADYLKAALSEMQRADPALHQIMEPTPDIAVVESPLDLAAMHEALGRVQPLFVRHIAPAQVRVILQGVDDDISQLAHATMEMAELAGLEADDRFSVQARVIAAPGGERPYSPYAIRNALVPQVQAATGAIEDVRQPQLVLSVLALPTLGFIGLSPVAFNRSDWAGGARRFAREQEQLSRSEFKLLEALEWGSVEVQPTMRALDLGAAPGGWTRVLLHAGVQHVTAVDPADLDGAILGDKRVTPVRDHAQEWVPRAIAKRQKFDLIVSDIRMDARDAARLMVEAAPLLVERTGVAIVTLKLPPPDTPGLDPTGIAREAIATLRSRYRGVQARMLFHNRNEVTVILSA